MKKIIIFIFCASILQLALHAENEVNATSSKIAKKRALLEQLTADEVSGIRFTFEISRREEFDKNIWQQIVTPVLAHMNEITKNNESLLLNKILLISKNIYEIAKETDFIEGKMSLTLADNSDLIRVKYDDAIITETKDPLNVQRIKLIFELSRDEIGHDINLWQKAVEIGSKTAKDILDDQNDQNIETVCTTMEKIYTILNGVSWAHATARIVLQSNEKIANDELKSCNEGSDDQTRSLNKDSVSEDDDQTDSLNEDDDDDLSSYRTPCEKCINKTISTEPGIQEFYEEANIEALEKDWKEVLDDKVDRHTDDEKYFFDDSCSECDQKL